MDKIKPLSVFVSSTCYDLVDLRYELRDFLVGRGFEVRLSEDPMSAFFVDPTDNSIESCLANVRACDIVVCVIDGRYGGVLTTGDWKDFSATEAEVRCAREKEPRKDVLFFMRDIAFQEFEQLRRKTGFRPTWVKGTPEQIQKWTDFVEYAVRLPEHADRSNWCDRFRAVSDLKPIVMKRLVEQFPSQAASLAMEPTRLVRLHFKVGEPAAPGRIEGWFENVGTGPALNLTHGIAQHSHFPPVQEFHQGGLAEGKRIELWDGAAHSYHIDNGPSAVVFCEYENRFRDRYRVEAHFKAISKGRPFEASGRERFLVWSPLGKWVEI